MWAVISGIIQIIYLIIKNSFERDAELRKKKEELYIESKDVIKSRDISKINNLLTRIRN